VTSAAAIDAAAFSLIQQLTARLEDISSGQNDR
jgi:hypothetical protein